MSKPIRLVQFTAFFIASVLVLKDATQILISNLIESQENLSYNMVDSVQYGGIALCIVGVSIFLKRNIWAYLFLLVIVASFFPFLSFTNFSVSLSFGSFKLNFITVALLLIHVLINIDMFRIPKPSKEQEEDSNTERVDYFTNIFEKKTDDELLRMDEKELVPEAIEALNMLKTKRSL